MINFKKHLERIKREKEGGLESFQEVDGKDRKNKEVDINLGGIWEDTEREGLTKKEQLSDLELGVIGSKGKIRAVIKYMVFYNKESFFVVMKLKNDRVGNFIAVGIFPYLNFYKKIEDLYEKECEIEGEWVSYKRYGKQFKFSRIEMLDEKLYFFLTKMIKGIGEKTAKKLLSKYKEEELEKILNENPDELLNFSGIQKKKLEKIINSWKEYRNLRRLSDFFLQYGINFSGNMLTRIYLYFNKRDISDYINLLKVNPYVLLDVDGIGFKTCDKIALMIGIDKYSDVRIKAILDYIFEIRGWNDGYTFLTSGQLKRELIKELDLIEEGKEVRKKVFNVVGKRLQTEDFKILELENLEDKKGEKFYFLRNNFVMEKSIILRLSLMLKLGDSFKYSYGNRDKEYSDEDIDIFIKYKEEMLGIKLSEKQRKAVESIIKEDYHVFLLCGYAGTGKTTISKIILDYFKERFTRDSIVCCALTGMASRRIHELTGYNSMTIHSLLKYDGRGFGYNKDNKLPYKVILLDEASMVNLPLFYCLLSAIREDAYFIMVGDNAQLPPIGIGNVFSDLLRYDWLPKTFLTDIYRQSQESVLVYFANEVRQGKVPENYKSQDFKDFRFKIKDGRLFHIDREKYLLSVQKSILDLVKKIKEKKGLNFLELNKKVQVISPKKKVFGVGTEDLNKIFQLELNKEKEIYIDEEKIIKLHDKVIHLKNENMEGIITSYKYDYLDVKEVNIYRDKRVFRVFNGDLGFIVGIDEDEEKFIVRYEGMDNYKYILYSFKEFKNIIDLGYAITVHKTQGNQFDFVIIPMVRSFLGGARDGFLNNKLLYTALTRAKKSVYLIGDSYVFEKACKNVSLQDRQTLLSLNSYIENRLERNGYEVYDEINIEFI